MKLENEALKRKLVAIETEKRKKTEELTRMEKELNQVWECLDEKDRHFTHLNSEFKDKILEMENYFNTEKKTLQNKLKSYESEEVNKNKTPPPFRYLMKKALKKKDN